MGKLYEYATRIEQEIQTSGLDVFRTRGAIAMRVGFIITLISPNDPDDATKIAALRKAALEVLNIHLD